MKAFKCMKKKGMPLIIFTMFDVIMLKMIRVDRRHEQGASLCKMHFNKLYKHVLLCTDLPGNTPCKDDDKDFISGG